MTRFFPLLGIVALVVSFGAWSKPIPHAGSAGADLAAMSNRCADDPSLFAAKTLSFDQTRSMVEFRDADGVRVYGDASSFVLSGPCTRALQGLAAGIHLHAGRWVQTSEPPFQLIATHETDTFRQPAQAFTVQPDIRVTPFPGSAKRRELSYRTSLYLDGKRRIGLWSGKAGAMIAIIQCPQDGQCTAPQPLVVSTHPIPEIYYIPSPDRAGSGMLRFWLRLTKESDASIGLSVTS